MTKDQYQNINKNLKNKFQSLQSTSENKLIGS
jgi:hypothetical protein